MLMNHDDLIIENQKLVYFIVRKYYPTYIFDEDIVQCGMVGLCKAAEKWDEKKAKFSTYAGRIIRNEINQEFIARKKHSQNVSLDKAVEGGNLIDLITGDVDVNVNDKDEFINYLSKEESTIWRLWANGYSVEEISIVTGCAQQKVRKLLRTVKSKWRIFNGN